MDSDTWILNMDMEIRDILDSKHVMFASMDVQGINCGVFAFRRCDKAFEILNQWYNTDEFEGQNWAESQSFWKLYPEIKHLIKHVSKLYWNSYPQERTIKTNVIHLPGENENARHEYFRQCMVGMIR